MYQSGVKEVNIPNCALNAIFEMFKSRFEKDDKKYQDTCDNRANAGSKGGQAKSNNAKQSVANLANDKFAKQSVANLADKDKEHDKDIDKDLKENIYSRAGTTVCVESDTESVQDETKEEPRPEQAKKAKESKADKEAIEVIDYLNTKTGSSYRATTEANIKPIRARLNDGFTVEDCKKVIDTKSGQWLNNPDMVKYLRPATLFSPSKFEGYLNECRGKPSIRGDSLPISEQAAFNQSISEAIQRQMLEPVENPVTVEMLDALGIK
ncbi:MAG: conserved phage C-terminal domain-containing protein [Lachnospiraceae bacterium]|nr:conserved phage C-terminal domain-containing protein [Lachnospiraceae bacterium]